MAIKTITAKNVTGTPVTLADLGLTILGNQQIDLTDFVRLEEIWESESLLAAINNDVVVIVVDGDDLTKQESISYTSPQIAAYDIDEVLDAATASPAPNELVRYDAQGRLTLRETGGPTNLTTGIIPDGSFLARQGSSIIGSTPAGGGDVAGPAGALNNGIVLFDGTSGKVLKDAGLTLGTVNDGEVLRRVGTAVVGDRRGLIKQTAFAEITANTTTTSTTFVTLLTLTVTIAALSRLRVAFSVGSSITAQNNSAEFRLLINGTPIRGTASRTPQNSANQVSSAALVYQQPTAPGAGTYTITIEWRTTGGTLRIQPVTTIAEHASLIVDEVAG